MSKPQPPQALTPTKPTPSSSLQSSIPSAPQHVIRTIPRRHCWWLPQFPQPKASSLTPPPTTRACPGCPLCPPSLPLLTQNRVGLRREAIPTPTTGGHPLGRWHTSVSGREGKGQRSPSCPHRRVSLGHPGSPGLVFPSVLPRTWFFACPGPLLSEHAQPFLIRKTIQLSNPS